MTDPVPAEGGAAAPAATPTPPDNQVVADIMSFDPFGPAKSADAGQDETGKPEGQAGEPGGEVKEPVVTEPVKPGEQPPIDPKASTTPAPAPTQQGPTQAELQAQIAALQAVIQSGTVQRPQEAKKPGEAPAPRYNLGLPPQVIQGLRSEDEQEFAVAMHAVVNGIANRLWGDMQEHLSKEVGPSFDQRIGAVISHQRQVDQVYQDFYSAHPHLNNPAIMPVVQNAAVAVGRQWAAQGKSIQWNKEFSDAVAAMVATIIPAPQAAVVPAQQPKPKTFTAQPGARPAAAPSNDFNDVLTAR